MDSTSESGFVKYLIPLLPGIMYLTPQDTNPSSCTATGDLPDAGAPELGEQETSVLKQLRLGAR